MIGAGGTGGHVYPALAVAEAIQMRDPAMADLSFVGTADGFERPLIQQSSVKFTSVDEILAGPLHGISPLRALGSLFRLAAGVFQSFGLILRRRPQVILLTGGWANVPLAVAAWISRVPTVVYLPDIEPGLTINLLKRFAKRVAITVAESAPYFREGQSIVTGYPLQKSRLTATREAGLSYFGLDAGRRTILVFGGSRGARSINIALLDILPQLLREEQVQVIHVTGELDWPRVQEQIAAMEPLPHYHVYPYLHDEMGLAMAAADIILCRAGASTLGEVPYFSAAAILVPYPHAWRYQKTNADYLADRGAAICMADESMHQELLETMRRLLHEPGLLEAMRAKSAGLRRADGAEALAQVLVEAAGK